MELRTTFIENLKKYRKEKRLSQMRLAELCDTSTSYIGEIEIGKKFPSVEMIQKLACAIEVAPYKLFMTADDTTMLHIPASKKQALIQQLQASIAEIVENC